jgi:Family of unknown function (DUF6427)
LIEIFRKNLFINSILLLPYIFVLRLDTLMHPVGYTLGPNSNVLQKIIFFNISDPLVQNIFANLLIFGHVLLINHIFIKNRLAKNVTLFPGLFYVIFITIIDENNLLTPILTANTFIILAVLNVLETYKLPQATAYIFNTGFILGLASLFYSPYFAFILFGVIALLQLRSFKITEKFQFFIGFGVPYFLLFTYRYWHGISFVDLDFIKEIFFRWPVFRTDGLITFYLCLSVILISLLVVLFNFGSLNGKKSIQAQKKIDIFYWVLLFCLLSFFIFSTPGLNHLMSLAFPLSVLLGCLVSDAKKHVLLEIVHVLVVSLIFITQFKLIQF